MDRLVSHLASLAFAAAERDRTRRRALHRPVLRLGSDLLPLLDDVETPAQEAAGKNDDPGGSRSPTPSASTSSRSSHLGCRRRRRRRGAILDMHPNTLRSRMKKLGIVFGRYEIS